MYNRNTCVRMAQSPGPGPDLTVVLMGRGRSSAGNTILGSERFPTGCGFEPVPAEVVSGSAAVEGCWITVVDTPGFTARDSDEDQLKKRLRMMEEQSDPGPHAVAHISDLISPSLWRIVHHQQIQSNFI
uniref:AIG1-type G domain-containing protein n=1 Tax=Oreochromis aureus TaxID=47969 RepID=A0A668UB41_OREAU